MISESSDIFEQIVPRRRSFTLQTASKILPIDMVERGYHVDCDDVIHQLICNGVMSDVKSIIVSWLLDWNCLQELNFSQGRGGQHANHI